MKVGRTTCVFQSVKFNLPHILKKVRRTYETLVLPCFFLLVIIGKTFSFFGIHKIWSNSISHPILGWPIDSRDERQKASPSIVSKYHIWFAKIKMILHWRGRMKIRFGGNYFVIPMANCRVKNKRCWLPLLRFVVAQSSSNDCRKIQETKMRIELMDPEHDGFVSREISLNWCASQSREMFSVTQEELKHFLWKVFGLGLKQMTFK